MKTKSIILCGISAAFIAVFSMLSVYIGTVPITLSLFAVFICAIILGAKNSAVSVMIYIFCGACGLPVFSAFRGGVGVLFGATGGYITAYIPTAVIVGLCSQRISKKSSVRQCFMLTLSGIFSLLICYLLGTMQYTAVTGITLASAFTICVLPFIPFDIAKLVAAVVVGLKIKNQLKKRGI